MTMNEALEEFDTNSKTFLICGPTATGHMHLRYQGDLRQLKAMFRHTRDTLKKRERIGNHPNRTH